MHKPIRFLAVLFLLMLSLCLVGCVHEVDDADIPIEDEVITFAIDNTVEDSIFAIFLTYYNKEGSFGSVSVRNADGKCLDDGEYSFGLDPKQNDGLDPENFAVRFSVCGADDQPIDISTFFFPVEFRETYCFTLLNDNGVLTVSGASAATRVDHLQTNSELLTGAMLIAGEETEVYGIVKPDKLLLYRNSAEHIPVAELDYLLTIDSMEGLNMSLELADLDGDGNSDPTLVMQAEDESRIVMLWMYDADSESYVAQTFDATPLQ